MDNTRRNFFRKLSAVSVALGFGSKIGSTEDLLSEVGQISQLDFPLTVKTKYYFPPGKTPVDIKQDLDIWGSDKKMASLYKEFMNDGKVSFKMDLNFKKDHLELKSYFKDLQSYNEYTAAVEKAHIVNCDLQNKLGYKIVVEIG